MRKSENWNGPINLFSAKSLPPSQNARCLLLIECHSPKRVKKTVSSADRIAFGSQMPQPRGVTGTRSKETVPAIRLQMSRMREG